MVLLFYFSPPEHMGKPEAGSVSFLQSAKGLVGDGVRYGKYHLSNWRAS